MSIHLSSAMSSNQRSTSDMAAGREKTYFEQQREVLIGEIAMVRHPAHPVAVCRSHSPIWTLLSQDEPC
jgi:hypothetical protein